MGVELVRCWAGVTSTEDAEPYLDHLREDTVPLLQGLAGFLGIEVLRRDLEADEVEFVVHTRWQDLDAVRAFAGDSLDVAVVPPVAAALLKRYDDAVVHRVVAMQR